MVTSNNSNVFYDVLAVIKQLVKLSINKMFIIEKFCNLDQQGYLDQQ